MNWKIISALVVLASSFIAGWHVNGWRIESDYLNKMEGARQALAATAAEIAKVDVKNTIIRQKVQEHVIEKIVYRDCMHDDDGLRLVNEALSGQPIDNSKLPNPSAAE